MGFSTSESLNSISHFAPSLNATVTRSNALITRPIHGPITTQSPEKKDLTLESFLLFTSLIMSPELVSKSTNIATPTTRPS
uniref:Uncharacterized protein n=1 Tax=Arundo donax TaxID=35708 RepID=A0A0A8YAM9_ARUDO